MSQTRFAATARRSLSLGLALLLTLATLGSLQTLAQPDASAASAPQLVQASSDIGA